MRLGTRRKGNKPFCLLSDAKPMPEHPSILEHGSRRFLNSRRTKFRGTEKWPMEISKIDLQPETGPGVHRRRAPVFPSFRTAAPVHLPLSITASVPQKDILKRVVYLPRRQC